ncbi:unnamed protein product [Diamesa tonsa]
MSANCEIKFDNNARGIFTSGQNLTGTVLLSLDKVKKFRGLCLKIEGFAKCSWTVRKGHGNQRRQVTYSGREDYLSTTTYLFGSDSGNPIELAAGIHTYSFACALPQKLPSSFEAKNGYVRYIVRTTLDRPWKFDLSFKLPFTVIKHEDLNALSPALKVPSKTEVSKAFYCCCFKSKPLLMKVSLPFSGYVPGQSVNVVVELNNQSNVDVEGIKLALEKTITYTSQSPRPKIKIEHGTIKEVFGVGVLNECTGQVAISLVVPPIPPTNISSCKVLKVAYELKVLAKVSGAHRNPFVTIPITIGTIPLSFDNRPAPNLNPNTSIASSSYPTAPVLDSRDLPPPSYEQAMGTVVTEMEGENEAELNLFNPLYPVWNFTGQDIPQNVAPPSYSQSTYVQEKPPTIPLK